jgi:hypothetical protein
MPTVAEAAADIRQRQLTSGRDAMIAVFVERGGSHHALTVMRDGAATTNHLHFYHRPIRPSLVCLC